MAPYWLATIPLIAEVEGQIVTPANVITTLAVTLCTLFGLAIRRSFAESKAKDKMIITLHEQFVQEVKDCKKETECIHASYQDRDDQHRKEDRDAQEVQLSKVCVAFETALSKSSEQQREVMAEFTNQLSKQLDNFEKERDQAARFYHADRRRQEASVKVVNGKLDNHAKKLDVIIEAVKKRDVH
jgi:hypothetical protein